MAPQALFTMSRIGRTRNSWSLAFRLRSFPSCSCFCMEALAEFIKAISVHDFGWKEIPKSKVRRPVHLHFRGVHNAHVNSQAKTLIGRVLFHAILNLAWWLPSVERRGSSLLPVT